MSDAPHTRGLSLEGIGKRFGPIDALAEVDFSLCPGEIHALIGENGAGKSTLLKLLSGAFLPDTGTIKVDGLPVVLDRPARARSAGIAIIHQELNNFPDMSVMHNLFIGREHRLGRGWLSPRRMRRAAEEMVFRVGLNLDVGQPVGRFGVAVQQMIEIARALDEDSRYLLMDEPTASLSERETEQLFAIMNELTARDIGIVYISHRLEEVERVADRITILRDGRRVYAGPKGELSDEEIIAHMVGRPMSNHYPPRPQRVPGDEALRVEPASSDLANPPGLPFVARHGEVIGIAGLVGAGRTEWAWRAVGAAASIGEKVFLRGKPVRIGSVHEARSLGIGMVPEDRRRHGLVLSAGVADNIVLASIDRLSRFGWLDRAGGRARAQEQGRNLRIRYSGLDARTETLSGGNQQKVVCAKWLLRDCDIIVLDEPTRGIDVGARYDIYALIHDLAARGRSVIVISSDLPELLALTDRIYVMHGHRFVWSCDAVNATQTEIMRHASGLQRMAA